VETVLELAIRGTDDGDDDGGYTKRFWLLFKPLTQVGLLLCFCANKPVDRWDICLMQISDNYA